MPSSPPPTPMSPAPPSSPAALAALLATALADVERLKHDLDAAHRRAAAAENILRALAPDDHQAPADPLLSPAALNSLIQAESRAGAAEARLQGVLDAWADLLRTEERAADERRRIDDDARAARRALYPAPSTARRPRHPFPGGGGGSAGSVPAVPLANGTSGSPNPRIRPRTASDAAHPHSPAKRARNNSWTDRAPSRSPDALAGPGQSPDPAAHALGAVAGHHHAHGHPEPSVEDLILETVERAPRAARLPLALQPEPTLLNVPAPSSQPPSASPSAAELPHKPAQQTLPKTTVPSGNSGPRTCRQCGQPGRYKDGKCVEKWGPGPEGPGTVCDRCRKKMKRVERRGDSSAHIVHPVSAASSVAAISAAPPASAVAAPALTVAPASPPPTFSPLPPSPHSHSHSSSGSPTDDIASSHEGSQADLAVKRESPLGVV